MAKRTGKPPARPQTKPAESADEKPRSETATDARQPEAATKRPAPAKGNVWVRLLKGRTGYGRAGAVVEYPADEAERHSQQPFESVEILDD